MKRIRATMSQSALAMSGCTLWTSLASRWYRDDLGDTTKRDRGTEFHTYPAQEIAGNPRPMPPNDREMVSMVSHASRWIRDSLTMAEWAMSEVAFGLNIITGAGEVLITENREYPDEPDMFFGTADVVAKVGPSTLLIADWKTGLGIGTEYQLLSLAAAASRSCPWATEFRLVGLFVDPYGLDPKERVYSLEEVELYSAKLRRALSVITPAKPSSSCIRHYCPHLAFCPATDDAIRGLLKETMPAIKFTDTVTDAKQAAIQVRAAQAAKRAAEHYLEAAKEFIRKGGRVLDGDSEWKQTSNGVRWEKVK